MLAWLKSARFAVIFQLTPTNVTAHLPRNVDQTRFVLPGSTHLLVYWAPVAREVMWDRDNPWCRVFFRPVSAEGRNSDCCGGGGCCWWWWWWWLLPGSGHLRVFSCPEATFLRRVESHRDTGGNTPSAPKTRLIWKSSCLVCFVFFCDWFII